MTETTSLRGDEADKIARRLFLNWHSMERIDELSSDQLDQLPFGAIQLDRQGRIISYNMTEAKISGRDPQKVMGKSFFDEVAPCTNVKEFAGRFKQGIESETLNEVFPYTFDFQMEPAQVWIRLYYSRNTRSAWVFVTQRREEDTPDPEPSPG